MAASHATTSGTSATAGASTARGLSGPAQSVATGTPTRFSTAPILTRVGILHVVDGTGALEQRLADVVATAPGRLRAAIRDDGQCGGDGDGRGGGIRAGRRRKAELALAEDNRRQIEKEPKEGVEHEFLRILLRDKAPSVAEIRQNAPWHSSLVGRC